MRLSTDTPLTCYELEFYRQMVYSNIMEGMKTILDAWWYLDIKLPEEHTRFAQMITEEAPLDLKDRQAFPRRYYEPLQKLWENESVRWACERGGWACVPDK